MDILIRIVDPFNFCMGILSRDCMSAYAALYPFTMFYWMALVGLILWIPAKIVSLFTGDDI